MWRLSLLFVLLLGCQEKVDKDQCLEWYTKAYKGHPPSAHKFEKHCQGTALAPKLNCQKAFNELVLGSTEARMRAKFGKGVLKCFTESEIKKHLK